MNQFSAIDYVVFAAMLGLSVVVGLYFGFFTKQDTVRDYLLGSKNFQSFPITLSLISSMISGVTLLGFPTEVYKYGTQIMVTIFGYTCGILVSAYVFLPIFYKLELLSLFEYLEMRFNKTVRLLCSFYYSTALILYTPIVIYGPALVLHQVTGLGVEVTTLTISLVCIFYTSLGGLKAVVWSDTIQCVFMMFSVFSILFLGLEKVGGVSEVYRIAQEGDRWQFLNMDPDPRTRMSFWVATVGHTFSFGAYIATNPAVVQRLSALPSYGQAKKSLLSMICGIFGFTLPSMFFGLLIYVAYYSCDLIKSKTVKNEDQILPYFVMDVAGHIPGLPGLFTVGICSAALSTMSTTLNSISATVFEDFMLPLLPKNYSDVRSSFIMKVITVVAGIICIVIVGIIDRADSILTLNYVFSGVTSGPSFSVFLMAALFPTVTSKGAIAGSVVSSLVLLTISIGNRVALKREYVSITSKPMRLDGCSNSTLGAVAATMQSALEPQETLNWFFEICQLTIFYYSMVGALIGVTVGLIVSHLTGPNRVKDIHPDLLSNVIHVFLPKERYESVPLQGAV